MKYRNSLHRVAALGLCVLASQCLAQVVVVSPATQPVLPPAQPMTITGIVLDQDLKPIPNAKIWLASSQTQTADRSITGQADEKGNFKLEGDTSTRTIIAAAPGFGIGGEQVITPQITPGTAPVPQQTAVILSPKSDVHVKLIGYDGKPAAGVTVFFGGDGYSRSRVVGSNGYLSAVPKDLESHFTQTSDASGECVFTDWPQDFAASIDVGDDRFARVGYNEMVTIQRSPKTEYTLKLEPGGSISGKVVVEGTGAAVPGAQVRVTPGMYSSDNRPPVPSQPVVSDAEGKYSIKRLSAGEYDVSATVPPDFAKKFVAMPLSSISLSKGVDFTGQDLKLSAGVAIKGKVTDRNGGAPVPNVRITIRDMQSRVGDSNYVITDAEGNYEAHTSPGQKQFTASPMPTTMQAGQQYASMGKTAVIAAEGNAPVDFQLPMISTAARGATSGPMIVAGTRGRIVNAGAGVAAGPSATVRGIVIDPDGKPVPYAGLSVETPPSQDGNRVGGLVLLDRAVARTDAEGKFELPSVRAGSFIHARAGKLATAKGFPITTDGSEMKVTVSQDGMTSAEVKVVDPAGKPIENASLSLIITTPGDGGGISTSSMNRTTDANGIWVYSPLPVDQNYSIQVTATGFGRGSSKLDMVSGKQSQLTLTLKRTDSFVSGMAMDEQGAPLANAVIRASSPSGQAFAKTDETGMFRIENLVKDDSVILYVMDGTRAAGTQRAVAGKEELVVLTRTPLPAPVAGRAARGGGAPAP